MNEIVIDEQISIESVIAEQIAIESVIAIDGAVTVNESDGAVTVNESDGGAIDHEHDEAIENANGDGLILDVWEVRSQTPFEPTGWMSRQVEHSEQLRFQQQESQLPYALLGWLLNAQQA